MCEEECQKSLVTVERHLCLPVHWQHWLHLGGPEQPFFLEETDVPLFAEMLDLCRKYFINMLTLILMTRQSAKKDNSVLMEKKAYTKDNYETKYVLSLLPICVKTYFLNVLSVNDKYFKNLLHILHVKCLI